MADAERQERHEAPRGDNSPASEKDAFLDTSNNEKSPPTNGELAVFWIILLHGIGVLMPWNMFITIAPQYYVAYRFMPNGTATWYSNNFMSLLGVASQLPNAAMNIFNIFIVLKGSVFFRIRLSLAVNICLVIFTIGLIFVKTDESSMFTFFLVTMVSIVLLNGANGMYQNTVYGICADFPFKFTNAVVVGNNLCGAVTSTINIAVILFFPGQIVAVSAAYFALSLLFLVACLLSIFPLSRSSFFNHYFEAGERRRAIEKSSSPSLAQCWACIKECWVQYYNVFVVFFVTLTIFPAMMARVAPREPYSFILTEHLFVPVTTFLLFNVFAFLGSTAANYVQWPSAKYLWVGTTLRFLLIPAFALCNYAPGERALPVLFEDEWVFVSLGVFMAFTSGYFSSLAMMYAPRAVSNEALAKTAGQMASVFLVLGIFFGVSFTFVVSWAVSLSG